MNTRREFIVRCGTGALVLNLAAKKAPFILASHAAEPEKKLGYALVGLGSLSTNQIAPALQKTKYCRLAGIVSGTPEKRKRWAAQYSIPEKNIYTYETFDRIKDNPDIDVIYVVLPTPCMANTRSARPRRASMFSAKSLWKSRLRKARRWLTPAKRTIVS